MAQRISFEERVRIEEMRAAGLSVEETARRLGRHRSTVHRKLRRCAAAGGYGAAAAPAGAEKRARHPGPAPGLPPAAAEALPAAQAKELRGAKAQPAGRLQAPSRPSGEPNASTSTSTLEVPIYGYVTCQ
ncbi:MAG: helix-turn-helix domain-containing protein [bacterium]|nr:helix-turn-helix domain-containing protein [bacterium]